MDNAKRTVFVSHPSLPSHENFANFIGNIVRKAGFEVQGRNERSTSSKITQEVVDQLRLASIVIADITDSSPNVLFEVGFAQSLGKPVLLIAERSSQTPFDLAVHSMVLYSGDEDGREFSKRLESAFNSLVEQLNAGQPTSIDDALAVDNNRKNVFISYSHVDKPYLDRLMVHLRPLETDGRFDMWVDTRLRAGDKWKDEIEIALARSSVVILLASADYLASEFIRNNELPQMLTAAEEKGTRILPLVLRPCRFSRHETLKHFQSLNDPAQPLALLPEDEREVFYDRMAFEVERNL